MVAMGAVVPLARMVAYAPRMPAPALVPAPPPTLGKKKGGAGAKGGGKKGGGKGTEVPLGSRDAAATMAAACLRFLSLVPQFLDELLSEPGPGLGPMEEGC